MPNDAFAAFVLRRIRELGISRQEFTRRAGISRSAFYKLISQQVKDVRLETLTKIAKTLNVNLLDLVALALGLPDNGSPPERRAAAGHGSSREVTRGFYGRKGRV